MLERPWTRRPIAAAIVATTTLAVVATLAALAWSATRATGATVVAWQPPPCPGPVEVRPAGMETGAWYRIDPLLEDGALAGQRLTLGTDADGRARDLALPAEAFAAGPFAGRVLVGSDDGRISTLRLVDVRLGCAWSVGASRDVIRRATLSPDGREIIEMRVDRGSRADLGVVRRPVEDPDRTRRLLPPIGPARAFGPTFTTEFTWSEGGDRLAVQSCGERACRTRVVDLVTGASSLVADPDLADLVGLTDERLVLYRACGGLPCALLSVPLDGRPAAVIHAEAGTARLSRDARGHVIVVHEIGVDGGALRMTGIDGHGTRRAPADPSGRRLVAVPSRSGVAAEIAAGSILLAPDGRIPIDGATPPTVRRIVDGSTRMLPEVAQ